MKVRSSDTNFVDRVDKFYSKLLPLIEEMQFTKGGPIIAFQVGKNYLLIIFLCELDITNFDFINRVI